MKKLISLFFLALLLLPGVARADAFADGRAAYVHEDYATAMKFWEPLAKQGNANAQDAIAMMYRDGEGVAQDDATAMKWFTKAAAQGHSSAETCLGDFYFSGLGVPVDFAKAAKWYRKGAAQGNSWAEMHLGFLYRDGSGVKRDYAAAAKWFRKAADQGQDQAQYNLGLFYAKGRGVLQDDAEALFWLDVSRLADDKEMPLDKKAQRLGEIENARLNMTSDGIEAVNKRVQDWQKAHAAPEPR